MTTTLFTAGLGDVIRIIYHRASYRHLCETTSPTAVLVASHNPYAIEIFRHHRNSSNFVIYELGHKYIEFLEAGMKGAEIVSALMNFAGLQMDTLLMGTSDGWTPIFDAPDNVSSSGHVVFCPFAGSVGARTFTPHFTEKLLEILRKLPVPVYIVTRSFPRNDPKGRIIHHNENAGAYAGGNIHVLDNLTVPASINLVKNACAYVGSWSSLHQAAWFANKPVAVFYPPDWGDVTKRTGYAFGIDRPDCFHSDFPSTNFALFERWLRDWAEAKTCHHESPPPDSGL